MDVRWGAGTWTHEPAEVRREGEDLLVTAVEGSDAWRTTSYGFIHASEHGLLAPFEYGTAVEVEYTAAFSEQFDQAGLFIHRSPSRWVKAATEYADGVLSAGAVVTNGCSDWSLAQVPQWLAERGRVPSACRTGRGVGVVPAAAAAARLPPRTG